MTNYGYLRVSTTKQDVENQRLGILEYSNSLNLGSLRFIEDVVSGMVSWRDRELGKLLFSCREGDSIVFAEISRIARSILQILEVLQFCASKGINIYVAKQRMTLDDSMQSKISATILGLAAEIERELISMRTKEAIAKRKAEGLPHGRRTGCLSSKLKLDEKEDEIRKYLNLGINKSAIAKLVNCAPATLYSWLARRNVKVA